MADRVRKQTAEFSIPEPHGLPTGVGGEFTEATSGFLNDMLLRLVRFLNGYINLGDGSSGSWAGNLDGQYIDHVFPSTPDTETKIPHGLKRRPNGYVVVRRDLACQIYDALPGSWSSSVIYLKSDTASATVKLLVW